MRTRCALLLALLAVIVSAMVAATASAALVVVPGSGYVWAQPGAAAVSSPHGRAFAR
jgi:hypothetical protein